MQFQVKSQRNLFFLLPLLYFFGRMILGLSLLPNNLEGAGDLDTYFAWAQNNGWIYFDAWSEYPPLFPWINKLIYLLSGGNYYFFLFLSVLVFSLAGALVIYVHGLIAERLHGQKEGFIRNLIFFGLLSPLPYTWWYFDLIPVLLMLLGIWYMLENKTVKSGVAIGLGILTKWFPVFALVAAWRCLPRKKALQVTLIALGLTALVFGGLSIVSPEMTTASLKAQFGRNSYQTLWALVDQNYTSGAVFLVEEQTNPALATYRRGNPAVIPTWATLLVFGALGLYSISKVKAEKESNLIAVLGITWALFLLWCPGWSPQWILYLLPLITLSLNWNKALFTASFFILLTIIEWPTLLIHGYFHTLWLIVPLRIGFFAYLIVSWVKALRNPQPPPEDKDLLPQT
jgi:hypothetical protein